MAQKAPPEVWQTILRYSVSVPIFFLGEGIRFDVATAVNAESKRNGDDCEHYSERPSISNSDNTSSSSSEEDSRSSQSIPRSSSPATPETSATSLSSPSTCSLSSKSSSTSSSPITFHTLTSNEWMDEVPYWESERTRNRLRRVCSTWNSYFNNPHSGLSHRYVRLSDVQHGRVPRKALETAIRVDLRPDCTCSCSEHCWMMGGDASSSSLGLYEDPEDVMYTIFGSFCVDMFKSALIKTTTIETIIGCSYTYFDRYFPIHEKFPALKVIHGGRVIEHELQILLDAFPGLEHLALTEGFVMDGLDAEYNQAKDGDEIEVVEGDGKKKANKMDNQDPVTLHSEHLQSLWLTPSVSLGIQNWNLPQLKHLFVYGLRLDDGYLFGFEDSSESGEGSGSSADIDRGIGAGNEAVQFKETAHVEGDRKQLVSILKSAGRNLHTLALDGGSSNPLVKAAIEKYCPNLGYLEIIG